MIKIPINKYSLKLYAILAIISLVIAIGLNIYYFWIQDSLKQKSLIQLQSKLKQELSLLEKEVQTLANQDSISFDLLNKTPAYYSIFVYENKQLKAWSEYRFILPASKSKSGSAFQFVENNSGRFLIYTFNKDEKLWIGAILLYRKYEIDNVYLNSSNNAYLFPKDFQILFKKKNAQNSVPIYAPNGEVLCYAYIGKKPMSQFLGLHLFLLSAWICSILFSGLWVGFYVQKLGKNQKPTYGALLWLSYLIVVRFAMLYWQIPFAWIEWDLFDAKLYASSFLSPSIGDLLLNLIALNLWLFYILRHYRNVKFTRRILQWMPTGRKILGFVFIIFSHLGIHIFLYILKTFFQHSKLNLDITQGANLVSLLWFAYLIFALSALAYFFITHILSRLFISFYKNTAWVIVLLVLLGSSLTYLTIIFFIDDYNYAIWAVVANTLYWILLLLMNFPKYIWSFKYLSSIYFFAGAVLCASVGSWGIYRFGEDKRNEEQSAFGALLLEERDALAEMTLRDAIPLIKKDKLIKMTFKNPSFLRKVAQEAINKQYLGSYFDKYEIETYFFDENKKDLSNSSDSLNQARTYDSYEKEFRKTFNESETDPEHIYFVSDFGVNYYCFITLKENKEVLGYILLNLRQKRDLSPAVYVYPELLLDKDFNRAVKTKKYSYALYANKKLKYSQGEYNYERDFQAKFLENEALTQGKEWNFGGYKHLVTIGGAGKKVVTSVPKYSYADAFTNFSLLFLLLVLAIVSGNLIYTLAAPLRQSRTKNSFASKIQLYLNLAFFLPMLVISITTLSIIGSSYQNDFDQSFIEKAQNIATNMLPYLEQIIENQKTENSLKESIGDMSRYAALDINVFNEKGYLIASSQPDIYERRNLLSTYINPKAYSALKEKSYKYLLTPESVGNLNYKTVYMPIKDYKTNRLMGIVSVPFFDSSYEVNQKLVEVIATIMRIFTTLFILLVIISYFASRILTIPLRMITQKIRRTTLSEYNEPLDWSSEDEIGLLVNEYNQMLVNLEASKKALARNEKETAWREMARQVAHEIKNPLTPMKLTLQHLQVKIQRFDEEIQKTLERSLDTLLTQVDTLSDIATSFSSFAKMPIPKSEQFEISSVLLSTEALYKNDKKIDLITEVEEGRFYVMGDQQLMGRIFTNLFLNAIQAVPEGKRPKIEVSLKKTEEAWLRIAVKDNGAGIDSEIQEKVFVPNFSTKQHGSGIGLAVAKRGVEHAGGKIWFETEIGEGTTFYIELPLLG